MEFKHARDRHLLTFLVLGLAVQTDAIAARIVPGALELEERQHLPADPGDVIEPETDADGAKADREFVIAPLPSRSPLLGWTLALPAF